MADNVAITAGSGTTIATDDTGTAHVQWVKLYWGGDGTFTAVTVADPFPTHSIGGDTFATGEASVTTASGSAVAARAGRISLTVRAALANTAAITIGQSGVASGTGLDLYPGDAVTLPGAGALHADAASGTQILEYIEVY